MKIPRIYQNRPLAIHQTIVLDNDAAGHVGRVLRMKVDEQIQLFNGDGNDYLAQISTLNKKDIAVKLLQSSANNSESSLHIHLGQVISRGDKMDFTIQKAVELGVATVTPLFSERCGVKLGGARLEKKQQQWQKIAISACEQCGRSYVPSVRPAISLDAWGREPSKALKLSLHPQATHGINSINLTTPEIRLLIGPEGGLSEQELALMRQYQFIDVKLGPRVLRTETAALTTISALQLKFGDLG